KLTTPFDRITPTLSELIISGLAC
ncbi:MAG: hypothetical protein JWM45_502, partial [Pseudonocardiales bacterium]|nr:hypothetical protein [Pseudonocardiales bacterium]